MSLPNLDELLAKCAELNLPVTPKGSKVGKQDAVDVLRTHFMPPEGLPYEEITPMLCFAEWNLKESEYEKVWKSDEWAAQRKLNGCRLMLHFVKGVGIFAHSRTVSVKTFRYQELTGQLLISDHKPDFSASIDCEVMIEKPIDTTNYTAGGGVTKSSLASTVAVLHLAPEQALAIQRDQDAPLHFHCFDVPMFEGRDLRRQSLKVRETFRSKVQSLLAPTNIGAVFVFPELVIADKMAFYKKILAEGGEGVILKKLSSYYIDSSSRRRDAWVKAKRELSLTRSCLASSAASLTLAGRTWLVRSSSLLRVLMGRTMYSATVATSRWKPETRSLSTMKRRTRSRCCRPCTGKLRRFRVRISLLEPSVCPIVELNGGAQSRVRMRSTRISASHRWLISKPPLSGLGRETYFIHRKFIDEVLRA